MAKLKDSTNNCLSNFLEVKAFSSRYTKPQDFGVRSHSIYTRKEGITFKIEQGYELLHYIDPENFVERIMASLEKTQVMERKFRNPKITSDIVHATNNKDCFWWVRFIIIVDWS